MGKLFFKGEITTQKKPLNEKKRDFFLDFGVFSVPVLILQAFRSVAG